MKFTEDSRVKIPALLHLNRLGYRYLSLKGATWDQHSNIFPTVFRDSLQKINPAAKPDEIERTLQEVSLLLDNEDLGKSDQSYHKFMAFYLRSKTFRKAMDNNAVMTLRCSLNEQIFSYLDLLLPDFNEQVKIGDFL
ncbi:MAG: restriction endonuclease subunit [Verrucomicrobia bacterium]|nr:restriction endonuclease subunit [Verrucomicrobiota bacterium]